MRAELALIVLCLCGAARAQDEPQSSETPDAALLEFLADWSAEDAQWLEHELTDPQTGNASVPSADKGQEAKHD